MQTRTMHEAYRGLLTELLYEGVNEVNARTGVKIRMLQGAHSFKLDMSDGRLPVPGNRRYYPHVAAAEVAWQFMGTKDPTFILSKAPKLWTKFLEVEDVTLTDTDNHGEVTRTERRKVLKTAYGWRWTKAFGRNQLALAVRELRENPTNRQLWVQAWDPRSDGLGGPQPKNVPCPIGFSVSRHKDDVHMSVFIRSSDVFVGLPYDVMGYALTLDSIAASIGCRPATLHFTLAHPHLYEPHWLAAEACLKGTTEMDYHKRKSLESGKDKKVMPTTSWPTDCGPTLPCWPIDDVLENPDGYVDTVRRLSMRAGSNPWDPMPEVIE